jgi:hypothetical protein
VLGNLWDEEPESTGVEDWISRSDLFGPVKQGLMPIVRTMYALSLNVVAPLVGANRCGTMLGQVARMSPGHNDVKWRKCVGSIHSCRATRLPWERVSDGAIG